MLSPWHYYISVLFSGPFRAWCMVSVSHLLKILWPPLDLWSLLVYFVDKMSPWNYCIILLFSGPFRACSMVWVFHLLKILWPPLDVWSCFVPFIDSCRLDIMPYHFQGHLGLTHLFFLTCWTPRCMYFGDEWMSPWHYSISVLFSWPFRACCMVWVSHLLKILWCNISFQHISNQSTLMPGVEVASNKL